MKSPMIYQIAEESCGAVSVLNCTNFLFEREEMPLEFLKILSSYSVSCYNGLGRLVDNEFSKSFMFFVSNWINDYAVLKKIPLKTKYLEKDDCNLLEIRKCLLAGGCVSMKDLFKKNHYITITNMDDEFMYIFDPLFESPSQSKKNIGIEIIDYEPFSYNRKVKIEHFVIEKKAELCLGERGKREAILFYRNDAVMQREFV